MDVRDNLVFFTMQGVFYSSTRYFFAGALDMTKSNAFVLAYLTTMDDSCTDIAAFTSDVQIAMTDHKVDSYLS